MATLIIVIITIGEVVIIIKLFKMAIISKRYKRLMSQREIREEK